MKILALQGSPTPDGHTQVVLEMVLEAASDAGAVTESVQVSELNLLASCDECFECQETPDEPGCVVPDDMAPVVRKALEADVIVFATPVFVEAPAPHLQFAMERLFCLFKASDDGDYVSLLAGRTMAAVITSEDGENGAEDVRDVCRRLSEFSETHWAGALMVTAISGNGVVGNESLRKRAGEFGRKLASPLASGTLMAS